MIAPLLPKFRAAFPRLGVELELTDQNLDLVADRIDLAIRLAPSYRGDVVGMKAFDIRYRVCAAPDYLSSTAPIDEPGDLAQHNCILLTLPRFRSRWIFRDKSGAVTDAKVRGDLVISSVLAIRAAALQGLGPVLLPHWLVRDDLRSGTLVDVFPEHDVTATDFTTGAWLLYPSRRHMPLKTRAAIDFFKSRLRSLAEE
jgi:DNA-binding transcriptional LysR family regulator